MQHEQDIQHAGAIPLDSQQPLLAYVVDAHKVGCLVRFVGERASHRARYSDEIQQNGVVIRNCHIVAVAGSGESQEVIWRLGTIGTVEEIAGEKIIVDLGYRVVTIPYQDERPVSEQAAALGAGDRVLLRGSPLENATITDTLGDGELAHPERLQARLDEVIERRRPQ
jgi:hypothetical protein